MGPRNGFEAQSGESSLARAVIYQLLARCFSYPDQELLDLFDSARIEEYLELWRYVGSDARGIMARIVGWVEECPNREAALKELEKEYTRLFVNAYPKLFAPPYSSVYLDKARRVWGPSTGEVARLYEAAGLGIAADFHDLPDHIAAELEFASYLIGEPLKGGENGSTPTPDLVSIEKRFFEGHLFKWAPVFFSRVIECSRVTFYREIALLAREFVEWDAALVSRNGP